MFCHVSCVPRAAGPCHPHPSFLCLLDPREHTRPGLWAPAPPARASVTSSPDKKIEMRRNQPKAQNFLRRHLI